MSVFFTRFYRDKQSTKHKKRSYYFVCVTILALPGNSLYIPSSCGCYLLNPVASIVQAAKSIVYYQLHIHCFSVRVFHFTLPIVWDMFNKHYVSGFDYISFLDVSYCAKWD